MKTFIDMMEKINKAAEEAKDILNSPKTLTYRMTADVRKRMQMIKVIAQNVRIEISKKFKETNSAK